MIRLFNSPHQREILQLLKILNGVKLVGGEKAEFAELRDVRDLQGESGGPDELPMEDVELEVSHGLERER